LKNKRIVLSRLFEKTFSRLPKEIRGSVYDKLELFLEDPSHPSLRIKKIKGSDYIWEMSVTMSYRITFQIREAEIVLRKIGPHDILRKP